MNPGVLTFAQVKAHIAGIRQKVTDEKPIGTYTRSRWTGEPSVMNDGKLYFIEH